MNVRSLLMVLVMAVLLVGRPDKKAGPAGAASTKAPGTATVKPQATPIKADQPSPYVQDSGPRNIIARTSFTVVP